MEEGRATQRGYIILFSVLGLVVGGVIGYFTPRAPTSTVPITISTPVPTATPPPTPTPHPIRVYVSGAVQNPAVYGFPIGSIVQDAIDAAGGPLADADLTRINLALELRDQQQVYVPREGDPHPLPAVSGGQSETEGSTGGVININTATAKDLEALPGIGEVTAQRVIDYREANGPFETIEDIQNVAGIGPKTFEAIREMIAVGS
ncbi:MAG: helix-hairpin-helix domain-containing protein [Chloroflexota bacterium]